MTVTQEVVIEGQAEAYEEDGNAAPVKMVVMDGIVIGHTVSL